ncbi:1,4-dihydroxy-2-naphthoate octaprenyltransferase [Microbacter margulisiae]|uniref:1,4-dihydroxy-2-naphthoate octaprenyltransferase n=1 Tax=Microbacter margulisiae TaxID=1350067 RepID=A0A7W5H0F9_9PORP|nr:1,4-dihydroxy-2-naphthoate octaprenyltransferase [Microbacter margulisiae]MBB3186513.1 1,4-dihydroxy-2-naphthoate octaprenyltransferase [Microbacter margulisiae]
MIKQFIKWFHIIRPGTLSAAAAPVFVGSIVAAQEHAFELSTVVVVFIAAIAIQIASNLINDYYDYKKGSDKENRLGPRRAISEGTVTPKAMKLAIGVDVIIALLAGFYLAALGGLPIIIIGLLALFFAWLYTATPYSLSYLGIADLFVLLFFGPIASAGTTYLLTDTFSETSIWLGLINGTISMAILTVNNLRDIDNDRKAGKKSLIVRFGKRFGEYEYLLLYLLAIPFLWMAESSFVLSYLIVLVGFFLFLKLRKTTGKQYNKMLIFTGLSNLLFVIFLLLDVILFG